MANCAMEAMALTAQPAHTNQIVSWHCMPPGQMPMPAEVIDGMVKISFTQETLEMLNEQEAICVLMSAE